VKFDEKCLEINLGRLEEDAAGQPNLMRQAGEALAKARKRVKETKQERKVAAAMLHSNVRSSPETYGVEGRVTEKVLDDIDALDEGLADLDKKIIELEYEEDVLDAFVKACGSRDRQLEVEAKLHGQMYFSKPDMSSSPRQLKAAAEAIMTAASDTAAKPKPRAKRNY
jgi:hypothetical protein